MPKKRKYKRDAKGRFVKAAAGTVLVALGRSPVPVIAAAASNRPSTARRADIKAVLRKAKPGKRVRSVIKAAVKAIHKAEAKAEDRAKRPRVSLRAVKGRRRGVKRR
jgi:hypothetical protein